MGEEEGDVKRSCHPFLLNLPLIFADSDSNGFTVTRRDENKRKKKIALAASRE